MGRECSFGAVVRVYLDLVEIHNQVEGGEVLRA